MSNNTQNAQVQDFFQKLQAHKNTSGGVAPATVPQPVNPPVAPAPAPVAQQPLPGTQAPQAVNPFLAAMQKRRAEETTAAPPPQPAAVPESFVAAAAATPQPAAAPAEEPKRGRGRPRKNGNAPVEEDADDNRSAWIAFASEALGHLVTMGFEPLAAANGAAQYADQMVAELLSRGI